MDRKKLLVISKNQKIKYFKKCKVTVNKITEELIIEPKNTAENEAFTIDFDKNYAKIKNLLCVFNSTTNENSYILILPNEEKCTKIYGSIQTKQTNSCNEKQLFQHLFLPLFNEIQINGFLKQILKKTGVVLIKLFSSNKLPKWLKKANIGLELFNEPFDVKIENAITVEKVNEKLASSQKRLATDKNINKPETKEEIEHERSPPPKKPKTEDINEIFKQNIAFNIFEIITYEDRGKLKTTLIVFTSTEKLQCFEYYWDNRLKFFKCCGCKSKAKDVRAEIVKRNGKDAIKPSQKPHVCDLRDFNREKYIFDAEKQIVKASNFEFVSYVKNGSSRKKLIVFLDDKKQKCYEYIYEKLRNVYLCAGCNMKHRRITANVIQQNGNDVVKLNALKHFCEPRDYKAEKFTYDPENQIIEESNFEILDFEEHGIAKRMLFIFSTEERKLCFEFCWNKSNHRFECKNCRTDGVTVIAKLCQKDAKSYVQLNSTQHVCDMVEYDPDKYTFDQSAQIVEPHNYKIIEYMKNGIQRKALIIFDPSNKKLCYEYYWSEKPKKFVCCGCLTDTVSATIHKNKNNKESVKLSKTQHSCTLREFNPDKYPTKKIIKPPSYRILKRRYQEKNVQRLIVFDEADSTLCYEYTWSKGHNYYICNTCMNAHKHFVNANIINAGKENEYVELSQKEHKCELRKFVAEEPEKKILKKPDFKTETYEDKDGNERQRIVFFDKNDKNFCYAFTYTKSNNCYKCHPCSFKHVFVSAKLLTDQNGDEYLEMNDAEHVCKPKKAEKIIVNLPNFKLENIVSNGKEKKILKIFDLNNKKKYYQYYYSNHTNCFYCYACTKTKKKKHLTAKLKKSENGEDYLELNSAEHVCKKRG